MRNAEGWRLEAEVMWSVKALALVLVILIMSGCEHMQVVAMANRDTAQLSADDITAILLQAGFSEKEILEYGTDVRNSLALRGAARVYQGNRSAAMLAVYHPYVHVSAEGRRSFVYDLRTGQVR